MSPRSCVLFPLAIHPFAKGKESTTLSTVFLCWFFVLFLFCFVYPSLKTFSFHFCPSPTLPHTHPFIDTQKKKKSLQDTLSLSCLATLEKKCVSSFKIYAPFCTKNGSSHFPFLLCVYGVSPPRT